jgi:hypothetical protein
MAKDIEDMTAADAAAVEGKTKRKLKNPDPDADAVPEGHKRIRIKGSAQPRLVAGKVGLDDGDIVVVPDAVADKWIGMKIADEVA